MLGLPRGPFRGGGVCRGGGRGAGAGHGLLKMSPHLHGLQHAQVQSVEPVSREGVVAHERGHLRSHLSRVDGLCLETVEERDRKRLVVLVKPAEFLITILLQDE